MTAADNTGSAILGVDIGGTKVAVGLVDHEGKIITHTRAPMVATGTAEDGLNAVISAVRLGESAIRSSVIGPLVNPSRPGPPPEEAGAPSGQGRPERRAGPPRQKENCPDGTPRPR